MQPELCHYSGIESLAVSSTKSTSVSCISQAPSECNRNCVITLELNHSLFPPPNQPLSRTYRRTERMQSDLCHGSGIESFAVSSTKSTSVRAYRHYRANAIGF